MLPGLGTPALPDPTHEGGSEAKTRSSADPDNDGSTRGRESLRPPAPQPRPDTARPVPGSSAGDRAQLRGPRRGHPGVRRPAYRAEGQWAVLQRDDLAPG